MLTDLIALKTVSLTLTTSANGQINVAVFGEGKNPLALTFSEEQAYQAAQEIKQYCKQSATAETSAARSELKSESEQTNEDACSTQSYLSEEFGI